MELSELENTKMNENSTVPKELLSPKELPQYITDRIMKDTKADNKFAIIVVVTFGVLAIACGITFICSILFWSLFATICTGMGLFCFGIIALGLYKIMYNDITTTSKSLQTGDFKWYKDIVYKKDIEHANMQDMTLDETDYYIITQSDHRRISIMGEKQEYDTLKIGDHVAIIVDSNNNIYGAYKLN